MNLTDFFAANGIELYSVIDFKNVKVINPRMLQRFPDFSPQSVLMMAIPYFIGEPDKRNISLYAMSMDYHLFFMDLSSRLVKILSDLYPNNRFISFADSSPIDERHAAAISGIGIIGKNRLLITEKYGSYVFLGEIISDLGCDGFFGKTPDIVPISSCLLCNACQRSCPVSKYGICLSALTQKKGTLSDKEVSMLVEYKSVWGCDICQSVCPHNKNIAQTPIGFFRRNTYAYLDSELVKAMPKEEFEKRAWAWRGKNTVLRNLEIYEKAKNIKLHPSGEKQ